MSTGEIINRVVSSSLMTIDVEEMLDLIRPRVVFDLSDYLYQGLILKESEFRKALSQMRWDKYRDAVVAVQCSTDAIIPQWAYLLVSVYLHKWAAFVGCGTTTEVDQQFLIYKISLLDLEAYRDKKVVVKGCSKTNLSLSAYTLLSYRLTGVVYSLMYGEPCSTVPIFKKAKH